MGDTPPPLTPVKRPTLLHSAAGGGNGKEDEVVPERLGLEDVRMLAAMKVHGVSPEDLSAVSPPPPPPKPAYGGPSPRSRAGTPTPSADMQKRRQELWERKRVELLAEVEETASMLDQESAERILAPDPMSVAKTAGRASVVNPQACNAKIEALRTAAENEAQKMVEEHRSKLLRLQESAERREQVQQRLAQQRKEQHEKLLEKIQKRTEKEAKTTELVNTNITQQRADAKNLMSKLKQSFQKAKDHKQQTLENWNGVKEQRIRHIGEVLDKKVELQHAAQEELVRMYQEKEAQTSVRMAELQERLGKRTEAARDKFSDKQAALQKMAEERQAEKEEAYKKTAAGLQRAGEVVATKYEERTQAVKEHLEKRFTQKDTVMATVRSKKMEKRKETMERMKRKSIGPDSPKHKVLGEWLQKRSERKDVMDELVFRNQQRLEKANSFARDQMLCKIQENNARVDGIVEQRISLQEQRAQLIKESMVEKARLEEQMRHVKFVPPASKETEEKTDEKK
eukprot:TRINITY_DN10188_c0_g1_i1.p1 TRINITY_DN10188_c0_g1~~TRINITY_DN10188_c0_g1_i1.p1  ORF type:complete len:512 (-),score=145.65 TRINITY_DN10188_c0_g1_i1:192-1727(-)